MAVAGNMLKNQNNNKMLLNPTQLMSNNFYNSIQYFEIEKQIGKGQFSEVFRAKCVADNRTFALKRIRVKMRKILFSDLKYFLFY
jgi:serine/threonine protein kinase